MGNSKGRMKTFEIILLNLGIIIGYWITFYMRYLGNIPEKNLTAFIKIIPLIVLASLVVIYIYDLSNLHNKSFYENIITVFIVVGIINISTGFLAYFARQFAYPRSVIFISFFVNSAILIVIKYIFYKRNNKITESYKKLFITNESSFDHFKSIGENVDFISVEKLNGFDEIEQYHIVYIDDSLDIILKSKIVERADNLEMDVFIVPNQFEISLMNSKLNQLDNIPLLEILKCEISFERRLIKRVFDLILGCFFTLIALPVIIIVAIIIKVSDRGNIFYSQSRLSYEGRAFKILKFRTMVMNAEAISGPVLATENDARITPVGRFLRRTRIDELPQLFNVVMGDMSLVGPRPERPEFYERIEKQVPEFRKRLKAKAGITGLAQIMGNYTLDSKDKFKYDLIYIQKNSVFMDIQIIMMTLKVIFLKEKSE